MSYKWDCTSPAKSYEGEIKMKMIMIIRPENRNEELRELITKHDIHAYT